MTKRELYGFAVEIGAPVAKVAGVLVFRRVSASWAPEAALPWPSSVRPQSYHQPLAPVRAAAPQCGSLDLWLSRLLEVSWHWNTDLDQ